MTLYDLQQGEKAIISKVRGRGAFRKRIMEMGFIVGKEVIVGKKAPLKDPIEYTIMGYNVSLRNSEAQLIDVVTGPTANTNSKSFNGIISEGAQKLGTKFRSKEINISLVGNPNCGKTTLFNYASKSHAEVGNYGGVTVDAKRAKFKHKGYTFNIIDLPGTYSITSYTPEEIYVKNYLFTEIPDVIVNVIDASNLERNLYLTTQLIDLDLKVVAALNMYDELEKRKDKFDYPALGKMIGIPIIPTIGTKGTGLLYLFDKIIDVYEDKDPIVRHIHIAYGQETEHAIKRIQEKITITDNKKLTNIIAPRFLSIRLLEKDAEEEKRVKKECVNYQEILKTTQEEITKIENTYKDSVESVITDYKYGFIEGALKETYEESPKNIRQYSRQIDNFLTNKFLSYPIFIFLMWLMFQSTFNLGAYPMEWLEYLTGLLGIFMSNILPEGIIRDLLVDGIIGGVGSVIVFLPNILILFFFISVMEDTGYLARVAFIVDKLMHKIGLHGRSFIPMLMGFGCNVPAIMATRTIGGRNERLITMLINPFMSCSARLPVYVLIIGAFFPKHPGLILFAIYSAGIIISILIAMVFKKTLFKSQGLPFVMELPPYRLPGLKSLLRHTWFKGAQYLKKMGNVILIASIIIWALGYFPRSTEKEDHFNSSLIEENLKFNHLSRNAHSNIELESIKKQHEATLSQIELQRQSYQQENSFIGRIGHFIEPALLPLGFDWKLGVSLLAGIAGKEIVVSTLGVLHQTDITADASSKGLSKKLQTQTFTHPQKKGEKVLTPLTAFGFLIFILIYFPCVAVIAAIRKESGGWKWALFLAGYTTALAYLLAFSIHQIGSLF